MAPVNSVTRAETDLSVRGHQDLENLKASVLGRRCQEVRGWRSITGLPAKGNKDILACEPRTLVLETAGTHGGSQTGSLRALGCPGCEGEGSTWSGFSTTYSYLFYLV